MVYGGSKPPPYGLQGAEADCRRGRRPRLPAASSEKNIGGRLIASPTA